MLAVLLLASCATTQGPSELELLTANLETANAELAGLRDRVQVLEATIATLESRLAESEALAATRGLALEEAEIRHAELDSTLQSTSRQKTVAEARIRDLERLLRDLSFAASLGPAQSGQNSQIPGELVQSVQTVLASSPAYETVASVLPYQVSGRETRTFVSGSPVFEEKESSSGARYFYDRRANYSNDARMYGEIRIGRAGTPGSGAGQAIQFFLAIQALSERSSADLVVSKVEVISGAEVRELRGPVRTELLQDASQKLTRLVFSTASPGFREALELIVSQPDGALPAIVLHTDTQRLRFTLSEVERGALIEIIRTYRDLGGAFPAR